MGVGGLVVQWVVHYGIYDVGNYTEYTQIAYLFLKNLSFNHFPKNFEKEEEEYNLINIVYNYIVPRITAIRKELEIIVVFNDNSQELCKKRINNQHGKVF